jgi:parallel beta-helix repeat protein
VDVGGDLPIIDASGIGNAIEISADQVILENIVCTNSSRSGMSPGAGVRFSSSNNCSMERIELYNNYYGINLADSTNNTISECNISDNQYGVRIYFSNSNWLQHNDVRKNLNPLHIVSSEGNIISDNTFTDNSHEVETSKDNKIVGNDENYIKDMNNIREVVELNAKPKPQPIQSSFSGKSKSSHSSGKGLERQPPLMNNEEGKEYDSLAQKAAGTLVFNPPSVMTSGVGEWVDARIGLENTTQLVQGLLGKGEIQFRNVSTETNMTYIVKLEGDSGLEIQAKRPDAQILGIDPAIWLWLVTPLKEGNHTLILSVDLQLEKPPFNCRCINVTYWPVSVRVLEPDAQQRVMNFMSSSYSLTTGAIAFLASLFSLIMLFRQFKKRN